MRPLTIADLLQYRKCPRAFFLSMQSQKPVQLEREGLCARAAQALRSGQSADMTGFLYAKTVRRDRLYAVADLLVKYDDGWELLLDTNAQSVREAHVWEAAFDALVLSGAGLPVKKATALLIDPEYVRGEEIDWKALYREQDITERALGRIANVKNHVATMKDILKTQEPVRHELCEICLKPRECEHWGQCSAHLEKPNVFSIVGMSNRRKFQLYRKNVVGYADCLKYAKLPRPQKMQVLFELEKRPAAVDKAAIKRFLSSVWYPMAFLDFESYQPVVPPYRGMKPFGQCAFLYSLHLLSDRHAGAEHHDLFVPYGQDPRRAIAEGLCRDIAPNACVAVYSSGLEKGVVKALAQLFPDLREHLTAIAANMRDMLGPFRERAYYDRRMEGSCSLKHVLPAIDETISYAELTGVHNGEEAMHVYEKMGSMQRKEREETQKQLREYCAMDTLALVKIMRTLEESIGK